MMSEFGTMSAQFMDDMILVKKNVFLLREFLDFACNRQGQSARLYDESFFPMIGPVSEQFDMQLGVATSGAIS